MVGVIAVLTEVAEVGALMIIIVFDRRDSVALVLLVNLAF